MNAEGVLNYKLAAGISYKKVPGVMSMSVKAFRTYALHIFGDVKDTNRRIHHA